MRIFKREYPVEIAESSGITLEKAKKQAQKEIDELLPQGQKTPNNFFYTIFINDEIVGYIWLLKHAKSVLYISDIYIYSKYRSKGYGTRALSWISTKARRLEFQSIKLHVFGHNQRAIELYERTGFKATSVYMEQKV